MTFGSTDDLPNDESNILGGVSKNTQNTFDLLAERCHGPRMSTNSLQSSFSPDSRKVKTNDALDTSASENKALLPKDHQTLISDNIMSRRFSGKSKHSSRANAQSTKGQRLESGRLFSDADLASAMAVATAAAGSIRYFNFMMTFLQIYLSVRQRYN